MKTNFVIACLLIASGVVPGTCHAEAPQNPRPIRVFLQTDDSGDAEDLAARRTSVRDLSQALAAKKKTIVVVENEENADVEIEIVDRAVTIPRVVLGIGPRPGQSPVATGPVKNAELRIRVTVPTSDLAADFKNKNKAADNVRGWKSAADDLADQVDRWIFEHRSAIGKGD